MSSKAGVTEERDDEYDTPNSTSTPTWCPAQQIYIGGIVPDSAEVQKLLDDNQGKLRLFGYGSLCWAPGSGTLSKPGVTTIPGRARGYKRCWCQKSADHRGTPAFPGIVCTLLRDDEVQDITSKHHDAPTMTEGLLYIVPSNLVEECLAELDFREKGGYARDVIDVVEDETGNVVKALLYRGTPDNPAFWTRPLIDLPFAAAIISKSIGPSGRNDVYLHKLDEFMKRAADSCPASAQALLDHTGDTDTGDLSSMVQALEDGTYELSFLFVSGSNQHNQLLMKSENENILLKNGEDAWELTETVLCTRRGNGNDRQVPKTLLAGGGHSGLLTEDGKLFLWGWNHHGQLGSCVSATTTDTPISCVDSLHDLVVEKAALGFSHTLVIEKGTGIIYAFGDNTRGQVDGTSSEERIDTPTTPSFAEGETFVHVAAGLFHSAAITAKGDVLTFGCGRFGQCLSTISNNGVCCGRWRPEDGSKLNRVVCGRRHTAVLDERGRVWTFGENKYGQLGRNIGDRKFDAIPRLVEGVVENGIAFSDLESGWSHTVAHRENSPQVFGWGRNDKGQLGTGSTDNVLAPAPLFDAVQDIHSVVCGSESTMVLDGGSVLLGCGWNEHGNLALGTDTDSLCLQPVTGARIVAPPCPNERHKAMREEERILMAKGGAHFLAMKV